MSLIESCAATLSGEFKFRSKCSAGAERGAVATRFLMRGVFASTRSLPLPVPYQSGLVVRFSVVVAFMTGWHNQADSNRQPVINGKEWR